MSKIKSNQDVENFIQSSATVNREHQWLNKDPLAGRVSSGKAHHIRLNDYEKSVIDAAAAKEIQPSATFIRQAALKRAKVILNII